MDDTTPATQDGPIMDGANEASAEDKADGIRAQAEADHAGGASAEGGPEGADASADAEKRIADLAQDAGSNQPRAHRPDPADSDARTDGAAD